MSRNPSSGLIPWLLLAVVGLIAYGSLYPFDLRFDGTHPSLSAAIQQLSWARAGRADRVRNVLLYTPLGFCLMLWLRQRVGVVLAALLATALGCLLSLVIEIVQVYVSTRVPSLRDVALNASGSLLGALAGVTWRSLSALVYLSPATRSRKGDRSALLVVCAWVLWRWSDFELSLSLTRLKLALQPLLEWTVSIPAVLYYLMLWLVVAQLVLSSFNRQRSHEVLLSVIVTVMVGRLLFVTPAFIPSELVALVLLLPTLILLHKLRGAPQSLLVLLVYGLWFLHGQLSPYEFSATSGRFDFWPFKQWLEQGMPIDAEALLGKCFAYAALIWLLKDAGMMMVLSRWLVVATVLLMEFVHLWQPVQQGSLTNPAIALCVGWLMQLASDERRPRPSRYRH